MDTVKLNLIYNHFDVSHYNCQVSFDRKSRNETTPEIINFRENVKRTISHREKLILLYSQTMDGTFCNTNFDYVKRE